MGSTAKTVSACLLLAWLSGCVTTAERVFNTEASPEDALKARVQLARSYIGEQNWEDAKRNLRLAAAIDPDNPEVHEAFALVYQSTGEYELAGASFERAIDLEHGFSRARNNYAAFLYARGLFEAAEQQLEIVVRDTLYESRPRAFVNLGLCRLQLGKPADAGAAFRRALTMDRSNRLALLELAHIEFGQSNWSTAEGYLHSYRKLVRRQSPRALWLGLRLAHQLDDVDRKASAALALRNLYPQSAELQAYERAVRRGEL